MNSAASMDAADKIKIQRPIPAGHLQSAITAILSCPTF
jgi:hypothetical protein